MEDPEAIARTESGFREVNEAIAKVAGQLRSDETDFVCECADPHCAHRLTADLDEYEEVRGHPARFLIKDGHEVASVEKVVARRRNYAVVEKVERTVARIARRLDPRARPV
jgi:hypothetical protein